MAEVNTAAGIFPTHFDLTEALRQLRLKHLELKQMSLAGRAPLRKVRGEPLFAGRLYGRGD